jgi:quinoprotein glucose dehydrogenase
LHGLHFGPDGRIYFSIGDRGANVKLPDGRSVSNPESGCVFRCNADGSELEVFAYGLRNPQDLVFDQYGNLFTGDNNSDSGDQARWVYVVEGGDSGWRVGYQFMENPYSRGPFNAEKLWCPHFDGQAAYIVPPVTNISSGPSGVAYFPGTGLPARFHDHFFLVDFRGGSSISGIHTFTLKPKGASFELTDPQHFLWNILPTDVKFGPDGGLYVSDWVEGWGMTGKGRIYRVHDPALDKDRLVLETKRLLAEGMTKRSLNELGKLLAHPDIRIRQEAQFELASRGDSATKVLESIASKNSNQLARIHSIWALGQILRALPNNSPLATLLRLLSDPDPEIRAQSAKLLGENRCLKACDPLVHLLRDQSSRVRFFAAMALGKLRSPESLPGIFALLRENADRDPLLRHAGVMALTRISDMDALSAAAKDNSSAVRMGALLPMRRLQRSEIALFLHDSDPALVLEAARAINDEPIPGAAQELAELLGSASITNSEPLLRRVLNANFRHGTPETAKALATFAVNFRAPEDMRAEALDELADWPHPSGRDRVIGLWRPIVAARHRETAVEALQPVLPDILHSAPDSVRIAATHAAHRLSIINTAPILRELVANTNLAPAVRVEALKTLPDLDPGHFEDTLKIAMSDPSEPLRKSAALLQTLVKSPNAASVLAASLDTGTTGDKQAALAALGALPDPAADEILARWLHDLLSGKIAPELQLDLLQAASKRSAPAVKKGLSRYRASLPKDDLLATYQETLFGGDADLGKKIFFERAEVQCVRCHKINGQGGDVGPDLSHVAAQKDRHYLLESVVLPNKQIAQGFESVMVVLKNGDSYAGVLKSETPSELLINSPETGLITVKKADIQSRKAALSPMPEGLNQLLSRSDLRNLIEFLSTLK